MLLQPAGQPSVPTSNLVVVTSQQLSASASASLSQAVPSSTTTSSVSSDMPLHFVSSPYVNMIMKYTYSILLNFYFQLNWVHCTNNIRLSKLYSSSEIWKLLFAQQDVHWWMLDLWIHGCSLNLMISDFLLKNMIRYALLFCLIIRFLLFDTRLIVYIVTVYLRFYVLRFWLGYIGISLKSQGRGQSARWIFKNPHNRHLFVCIVIGLLIDRNCGSL